MIPVREESPEVLYAALEVVRLRWPDLEELKALALQNPRKRVRICTHRSPGDLLHEMFIVHTKAGPISSCCTTTVKFVKP